MKESDSSTPASAIERAIQLLADGDVIGLPTETVYGLAARVDREEGLKKIFAVKKRPFFDPLIVHVDGAGMARWYVKEWPTAAEALARAFWPGPLSLVLPKSEKVPEIVTSGLPRVAVRAPRQEAALAIIRESGVGLAAPSANLFGRTSPTKAEHVAEEFAGKVFVVPSTPSEVGIESTVLKIDGEKLQILRPGAITAREISEALSAAGLPFQWEEAAQEGSPEAPGQLRHHYMPALPLLLVYGDQKPSREGRGVELQLSKEPAWAARELYAKLRDLSKSGADYIYFRCFPESGGESWQAIMDRLKKAASEIIGPAE